GKGLSREFLVGEDVANLGMARSAAAETRAAVWAEAGAPGGAFASEARAATTETRVATTERGGIGGSRAAAGQEPSPATVAERTTPASRAEAQPAARETPPVTSVDRETSVARSSRLESDRITPQEAAEEVAHVNEHPELIEGTPPHRSARVGDHEIVETPGRRGAIGCVRRSTGRLPVPCPRGMGGPAAAGTEQPVALTARQQRMMDRLLRRLDAQRLPREEAMRLLGISSEDELRALIAGARTEAELQTLLAQRAESRGVAARAEAEAAGRSAVPPEGYEDASRVLSPDDIRELARSHIPLPTEVERRMLQDVVDDVSSRLMLDPEEAARYLSQRELRAVGENPNLTAAYFGNAVERRAAQELADAPQLRRFLHTPQRPGVGTPDIGGPIGPTGPRAYDITTGTRRAIAAHQQRSYAPFTTLVTYPSLPPGWRFPPL
ncbi:MAG: hypothetical protein WCA32_07625, partial [Chromatiaceae bacterium]